MAIIAPTSGASAQPCTQQVLNKRQMHSRLLTASRAHPRQGWVRLALLALTAHLSLKVPCPWSSQPQLPFSSPNQTQPPPVSHQAGPAPTRPREQPRLPLQDSAHSLPSAFNIQLQGPLSVKPSLVESPHSNDTLYLLVTPLSTRARQVLPLRAWTRAGSPYPILPAQQGPSV